jgi:hypothetical protein
LAWVEGVLGEVKGLAGGEMLDGGVGLEGNAEAGERFHAVKKVGIERDAEAREGKKRGRVVRVFRGQHASGSGGGLTHCGAGVEDGDTSAAMVEFQRERETDDASTSDGDVWKCCCNGQN